MELGFVTQDKAAEEGGNQQEINMYRAAVQSVSFPFLVPHFPDQPHLKEYLMRGNLLL